MMGFHFFTCKPPLHVSTSDVELHLAKLYPHDVWDYKDLNEATKKFLSTELSHFVGYNEVAAICNNNGRGKQWGFILFRYPPTGRWIVVGQFGHSKHWRKFWKVRLWVARRMSWCDYKNQELAKPKRLDSLIHV